MRAEILGTASELAKRGQAFALATVVRREPPSSARVGDVALVTGDGVVHGWVGGSCTQPTVVREVLEALTDGTPRLITLSPSAEPRRNSSSAVIPMTCHSGGSVDIYIDPVLPAPQLLIFGTSPVARSLARLGKVMGYSVDVVDVAGEAVAIPEADRLITASDVARLHPQHPGLARRVFAVVATMGQHDEDALLTALALQPAYLGVVASRKRFKQIRDTIGARGAAVADVEKVSCPAGLDIGARSPEEIALSILAEIVQRRHGSPRLAEVEESVQERPEVATDPVCGMTVRPTNAGHRAEFGGHTYHFCSAGCRTRFVSEPERYAAPLVSLAARGDASPGAHG
jgi:xanthine dehydrogenase accessory factor